ncbi:MAG: hypothetical protein ACREUA_07040 [Burkholderiales bacterium]
MRVQILLYDGCDELDVVGPFEVLRIAAHAGAGIHAELTAVESVSEVTGAHGLRLHSESRLDIAVPPDVLVVPGAAG